MSMDKIIKLHNSTEEEAIAIKNMRAEIDKEKVLSQYNRMIDERKLRESLVIDPERDYKTGSVTEKNKKFQEVMKKKMPFINSTLSQVTCVAAGVVYLVAAKTGGGKSTTVANIVIPLLQANKKILIVSNEESRNHIFVRIACRILGYSFLKWTKSELPDNILDHIDVECERLSRIITVAGTDFQDNYKFVTTPEGLEMVFNRYANDHEVIILDYFQAISHGVSNSDPQVWVHQEKFCNFLNTFRNKFDGPIFIMSQLWPAKKKESHDFLERIKGRKAIGDVSLVHIEISPDKENYTAEFIIHKDRLWNNDGIRLLVGYDRESGNFVDYNEEFKTKSAKWIAARLAINSPDGDMEEDDSCVPAIDGAASVDALIQIREDAAEVENELNLSND